MKSTDYIVIQAPMITDLHLKGNALLLFALITGFSKDQNTRFRGSITYMCDWLGTSRSAVSDALERLERDGLIEKFPVLVGKRQFNEYSSRYNAIIEDLHQNTPVEAGNNIVNEVIDGTETVPVLKQYQSQNVVQQVVNGTETVLVPKQYQYQNSTQMVLKQYKTSTETVPNNIDNIYNNYSYCSLSAEEQEQEKQGLYQYFFFRNAVDPKEEVERFVGHNTANGWKNKDGREYDTAAKRQGLAALWQFQKGEGRVSEFALSIWKQLYDSALRGLLPGTSTLLDPTADIHQNEEAVLITCRKATRDYIENNIGTFRPVLLSLLQGRKLGYSINQK